MFRIFDDVKIISTPPAIYVDYYFWSTKTKAKSSSRFFSIIKTSCFVGCHWTMICAAASSIFRRINGRNSVCNRYIPKVTWCGFWYFDRDQVCFATCNRTYLNWVKLWLSWSVQSTAFHALSISKATATDETNFIKAKISKPTHKVYLSIPIINC